MKSIESLGIGLLALELLTIPAIISAQNTGGAFLKITPSARSYALGMSNGVTSLGAQAIRANPANLGLMSQRQSGNLVQKDQGGAAALLGGLSGGLGIRMGGARLDYAVSQQAVEFGTTQRIALSVQWGSRTPKAQKKRAKDVRSLKDKSDWMIMPVGGY